MVVALLGLGNVGRAVYDVLADKKNELNKKYNIYIKYILVRSLDKDIKDKARLTKDYSIIINDPEVDCVIEMLGASISYKLIKESLEASKHVITANKEVIARYYPELIEIAIRNNVNLLFEASVGGGIPVINTLLKMSEYNKITKIDGILNGTTNYILTTMHRRKLSFNEALLEAQGLGLAEADPTSDLEGLDMVRKIAILSMIAYNSRIDINSIYHLGIAGIDKDIISFIDLLGYRLKLICHSELKEDNTITLQVLPALASKESLLANVDYENNIVILNGELTGKLTLNGKGAGSATANAILLDLANLLSGIKQDFVPRLSLSSSSNEGLAGSYLVKPAKEIDERFVEKRIGDMVITKRITGKELNMLAPILSFSAIFID